MIRFKKNDPQHAELLAQIDSQPWGLGNAFMVRLMLLGLGIINAQNSGITIGDVRQVVREELDAKLSGLQLARLSAEEIEAIETEVAASALDGAAAWD